MKRTIVVMGASGTPNVLTESTAFHPYFPGFIPVDAWKVAKAYERALLGVVNGRILHV